MARRPTSGARRIIVCTRAQTTFSHA
jgi:hypothetical protein